MKKEAAVDEEGEWEAEVAVMGAGSAGWLELLSRQDAWVPTLPVVVVVMVVTGTSEVVKSLSASHIKPWVCWHIDREIRSKPSLAGFTASAYLPSTPFTPSLAQMDGQLL